MKLSFYCLRIDCHHDCLTQIWKHQKSKILQIRHGNYGFKNKLVWNAGGRKSTYMTNPILLLIVVFFTPSTFLYCFSFHFRSKWVSRRSWPRVNIIYLDFKCVFRTLYRVYDETSCKNSERLLAKQIFKMSNFLFCHKQNIYAGSIPWHNTEI